MNIPEPPIPPPCRIIKEGGSHGFCEECGSSVIRSWFGLGKVKGCIQPKCIEYHGYKNLGAGCNPPPLHRKRPTPLPPPPPPSYSHEAIIRASTDAAVERIREMRKRGIF